MTEWRLFEPGTVPECTTAAWYVGRERAPHLEQEAHRGRLDVAADLVVEALRSHGAGSVVDLGCGDGGLLSLLSQVVPDVPAWGYDLHHPNVAGAVVDRGVNVRHADVVTDEDLAWGDVAVCTEMLEHLLDPHAFLRRVAARSRFLVASSPFTETPESHYEHHTWAWDLEGYRELLLSAGFEVVRQETWSMFQILLGRKL